MSKPKKKIKFHFFLLFLAKRPLPKMRHLWHSFTFLKLNYFTNCLYYTSCPQTDNMKVLNFNFSLVKSHSVALSALHRYYNTVT